MPTSTSRKHHAHRNGLSPHGGVSHQQRERHAGVRATELGPEPQLLNQELFSHLLIRERKRSERSNRPFFLLRLEAKGRLDPRTSATGRAIIDAFAAATRGTDVLGWVKWPTVVGVICAEIGTAEPARAVETVRARIARELARRHVDPSAVAELSLDVHVYPEPVGAEGQASSRAVNPLFHADLQREAETRRFSDWLKRALDVSVSAGLLLALTPLLLTVALLVRLTSRGPIIFKQERLGKMGKPFRMLKFRTMYVNAAPNPHHEFVTRFIKESGRARATGKDQIFKLTNDPRITPVGRILRKTSIDELPQLWNVVIGDMSLVGPRPPLPYELEQYAPWHRRRILEAKPGITGLWQVTGRSRTTFDEMVRLDLRYAKTRSLWTDLGILLRTPAAVMGGKGAC
jgi:lipopolysaccharide/colanic/teichoic acid biosynthesis glycosyltransferase